MMGKELTASPPAEQARVALEFIGDEGMGVLSKFISCAARAG
jgi:hypothetical protein